MPEPRRSVAPDEETVQRALSALFLDNAQLRREDRKKAVEVTALLRQLAPYLRPQTLLVDAAAGRAPLGLLAQRLVAPCSLVVIDRDAGRIEACRRASADGPGPVDLRTADVADPGAWPPAPDVVVALHACGAASDHVITQAIRAAARHIFLVPCCIGSGVVFMPNAEALIRGLPLPRNAAVRNPIRDGFIHAWRTLRLEAAGYEVTLVPFVAPTVTPYNQLWRARRVGEPAAMARAAATLERLEEDSAAALKLGEERA